MAREKALITSFNSNPNVGLYGFATDKYCLIGREVPEKFYDRISKVLDVPVIPMTIAGTSLIGVFLNGNKNCLLIPKIVFPQELEVLDKHKIKYKIIDTKLTCLGNNMICTDSVCLVSQEYGEREIKFMKDALKVDVIKMKIARMNTLGSMVVHTNKGILCHHEILEDEAEVLHKYLKAKIVTGTVNMGNPFVGSGILCNNKGFIIGEMSGGPEIVNAEQALMRKNG